MLTSEWAFVPPGWAAPCSVLAVQVRVLNVWTQQPSVSLLHLLMCPQCCCCSECLSQTPELRTWSQSATTAPAGSSSAPCPEDHNCSSSRAETAQCWSDQVKHSTCPHRAAAESEPDPHPHWMMCCRVSWCVAEPELTRTVRFLTHTGVLIGRFWHSKITWWEVWRRWSKDCLLKLWILMSENLTIDSPNKP